MEDEFEERMARRAMNGETISSELALAYRRAGLSVLPAVKAKKRPAVGAWRTWAGRLPTEIEVEAWFSNAHDAVCIVAGKVSGYLECLDFDQKADAYDAWCAKIAPDVLDSLVVESTPSGGKHIVYRCEEPVEGNLKLAQGIRDGKRKTLIETRGEGGLFLCSPTPGYALERGDFEHIPIISKEARENLLSAARALDEPMPAQPQKNATQGLQLAFLTRPGDDFNQRGDIRPVLSANGWTLCGHNPDGNELWTRPGKDARTGHSATLKDGVFYVFSSNAAPFEPNKGYNAFQVYATLAHGGDFTAAAKELLMQGYGQTEANDLGVDLSAIVSDRSTPSEPADDDQSAAMEDFIDPGPMPTELYDVPGFVSELMGYTLRTAPYPNKALAFAGAFAMLAHLAGRKFKDPFGTRPNVYILSLAASGSGKQHPRSVNVSLAALKGFASEMGDYFASGEGLEDSMLVSPSMLFQIDEADALFNTVKMEDPRAEMLNSMLLRFFSESSSAHIMRKKALQKGQKASSSCIIQPHLTFLGTAVPKFLYQSLSERVLSNGLLARCLVLEAGERGEANESPDESDFPERVLDDIGELKRIGSECDLFSEFPQPRTVPMEAAARLRVNEIRREADANYRKYEKTNSEAALALWARAGEKVMKAALVYAISQSVSAPVITIEAVDWAYRLVFHATRRMLFQAGLYVYDTEFDRQVKNIRQKILSKGNGRLSYRALLRSIHMHKDEVMRIIDTMTARGEIETEQGRKGGLVFVLKR